MSIGPIARSEMHRLMSSPERTRLRHHKSEISSFRWTKIGFTVTTELKQ